MERKLYDASGEGRDELDVAGPLSPY